MNGVGVRLASEVKRLYRLCRAACVRRAAGDADDRASGARTIVSTNTAGVARTWRTGSNNRALMPRTARVPMRDPSPNTDLYVVPAGSGQASVTGQDWALQGFGECDVCGVVGAEVVAEGVGA